MVHYCMLIGLKMDLKNTKEFVYSMDHYSMVIGFKVGSEEYKGTSQKHGTLFHFIMV